MKKTFTLSHDHHEVAVIREQIKAEMLNQGYGDKKAFNAALLADELSNNAIQHGSSDEITLEIEITSKQAIISCENGVKDPKINAAHLKSKINEYEHHKELRGRGLSKLAPHYADELKIEDTVDSRIKVTAIIIL